MSSLMQSYNKMQNICKEYNVKLISRNIALKEAEIDPEEAKLKIPTDAAKRSGVILNIKVKKRPNGPSMIAVEGVGNLFDVDPREFENVIQSLSEIDLDASPFSAMDEFGDESEIEIDDDDLDLVDSVEDEIESDENDSQINEKFSRSDVINMIKENIDGEFGVCFMSDIEDVFGKEGVKIALDFVKNSKSYYYSDEEQFISKY